MDAELQLWRAANCKREAQTTLRNERNHGSIKILHTNFYTLHVSRRISFYGTRFCGVGRYGLKT